MAPMALFLLVAVTNVETRSCSGDTAEIPAAPPAGSEPGQLFTTEDGVRFRVETVVSSLEIPWALVFAPDGRLFVTERPGRVRIIDIARRTSSLALTLEDVFAQGEAGLLGLALESGIHVERTRVCVFHDPQRERRWVEPGLAVSGIEREADRTGGPPRQHSGQRHP